MFEPIDNKSNYKKIVNQIQTMIINRKLKLGDKLPPERELSEMLGVSRTSVREALKALEVIGIVESRHGEGNFIVNNLSSYTTNGLSIMYALNNGTLHELLELRRCLEVESARNIIERNDPKDIERLQDIIDAYNGANSDEERLKLDQCFHKTVIALSNNILYRYLFDMLAVLIIPYIADAVQLTIDNYPFPEKILIKEHNEMLNAIKAKDIDRVFTAYTCHFFTDVDMIKKLKKWSL